MSVRERESKIEGCAVEVRLFEFCVFVCVREGGYVCKREGGVCVREKESVLKYVGERERERETGGGWVRWGRQERERARARVSR